MIKAKILLVDDNESILNSLKILLKYHFSEITAISSPEDIPALMQKEHFDLFLLDMNFSMGDNSGRDGIYWLKEILDLDPLAVVIMITAYGSIALALEAIKLGALDFITKPWDTDKLLTTIQAGCTLRKSKLEVLNLQEKNHSINNLVNKSGTRIIGSSPAMKSLLKTVDKIANTEANVLITGENGTGKDLIAKEIHNRSGRREELLVHVDMGAISESLFESEMFGFKKGAFTDAYESRKGKFEISSGGSLFLDEIGNIPLSQQAKLLKVLQERKISPIGDHYEIELDLRIISASNKDIDKMVDEALFREDLLYRINTIRIHLPPLRERTEDIDELCDFFLHRYANKYDKKGIRINQTAINFLKKLPWPGNIRELEHSIEKAVILCDTEILGLKDFQIEAREGISYGIEEAFSLDEIEKQAISRSLIRNKGVLKDSAKELGISRTTLYAKIKKYEL